MSSNNPNSEMPPIGNTINKQLRIPQTDIYRDDKIHSSHMLFDHPEAYNNMGKSMQQPPPSAQMLASPPKYQPPPQPQGGILKNLTNNKKRKTIGSVGVDSNTHLVHKFPPELQKSSSSLGSEGPSSAIPVMTRSNTVVSAASVGNKTISPKIPQFQRPSMGTGIPAKPESQMPQNPTMLSSTQPDEIKIQNNFHHMYNPEAIRLPPTQKSDHDTVNSKSGIQSSSPSGEPLSRLPHSQNKHFQALVAELRAIKEANQRLSDDNQELRDLCCFLDDDRQKGRKLAREWQRFGRYTASVMRQEVSAYQNKLRQLDDKQQELIRDNLELKELCLYLDEERSNRNANPINCRNCGANVRPVRDEGDGSSFGTSEDQLQSELNQQSILTYQTLQYVRFLEQRISQLELETGANNNTPTNQANSATNATTTTKTTPENDLSSGRPEAVIRALQILEVREQLENDRSGNTPFSLDHMDDGEKALVREMCNVVWKKLEENPSDPRMDPL